MNCVILRYGEIALKGNNRRYFEDTLLNNVRDMLSSSNVEFDSVKM